MNSLSRRRLPWLVPIAAIAVTAGASGLARALPAGADPIPVLPPLSPSQLLDKVRTAQVTTLSGDVTLSSNLGLPSLASFGVQGGTMLDLLSGTHHAHIAVDGPEHVRLALDAPQAENDWIRNGTDVWSWDSSTQHVLHAVLPAPDASATDASGSDASDDASDATVPALDPQAAADRLLQSIDPTTDVSVRTPGYVAGRPVYELVVAPKSAVSTIGDGVISVDAATGVPLAVRVDARGATTPALSVTFTSVSFDKPAASTFAFTPPPGATVEEAASPADLLPLGGRHDHGDGAERGRRAKVTTPAAAPADAAPATAGTAAPHGVTLGSGWETVEIVSGQNLGGQFGALFANAPAITVGTHTAHLVTTALVNVLVLDDGRIAIGALTPDALVAAVARA